MEINNINNQELKIKFEENKVAIEKAKSLNQDTTALLKTKYDLLKLGFLAIKNKTQGEEFDKNPKKYSTLMSYINNMKQVAKEAKMPLDDVETLENDVKSEMKKNNLDWLIAK